MMNNLINNIMGMYNQFRSNPMQFMSSMNIPQQYAESPEKAIQFLMDNGKMSQSQYNQVMQMYRRIKG